jgi:MSHA pilin protein MshA
MEIKKLLNSKKREKGFTLIELVMVLVILGILAAIIVPKFVDLQSDSLSAAKKATSGAVKSSLAIYIAENKDYPTVAELAADISGGSAVTTGIQVSIDGTNYTVPTYTDSSCSTATDATTDTVACIGDIS